jgi:hypothetical protein
VMADADPAVAADLVEQRRCRQQVIVHVLRITSGPIFFASYS